MRAEVLGNCPCGDGPQSVQHMLLCFPEIEELSETMWEIQRETDIKTMLGSASGTSKAGSIVPYQHKITPTIFARKPILNRGRRLRH